MRNFNRNNNRLDDRKDFKKRNFGGRDSSDRFEMHRAICSKCGNDCEVPFRPITGKPVFCKACFANVRSSDTRRFEGKSPERKYENFSENRRGMGKGNNEDQYKKQFESLNWKLDKIIKILTPPALLEIVPKKPVEKEVKEFKPNKPTDNTKKKKPVVKKKTSV